MALVLSGCLGCLVVIDEVTTWFPLTKEPLLLAPVKTDDLEPFVDAEDKSGVDCAGRNVVACAEKAALRLCEPTLPVATCVARCDVCVCVRECVSARLHGQCPPHMHVDVLRDMRL